jgi:hypothetical protein
VDVLEAADPVVGRDDAQELAHPSFQAAGRSANLEVARDHPALEAVAQRHVEG